MSLLDQAENLLRECQAHVYRQMYHGRHEQDRKDAVDLHKRLADFLKRIGHAETDADEGE